MLIKSKEGYGNYDGKFNLEADELVFYFIYFSLCAHVAVGVSQSVSLVDLWFLFHSWISLDISVPFPL